MRARRGLSKQVGIRFYSVAGEETTPHTWPMKSLLSWSAFRGQKREVYAPTARLLTTKTLSHLAAICRHRHFKPGASRWRPIKSLHSASQRYAVSLIDRRVYFVRQPNGRSRIDLATRTVRTWLPHFRRNGGCDNRYSRVHQRRGYYREMNGICDVFVAHHRYVGASHSIEGAYRM